MVISKTNSLTKLTNLITITIAAAEAKRQQRKIIFDSDNNL